MDMNSAKILDEECNHNNDQFNDEALYAPWFEPARAQAGLAATVSTYSALTMMSFQNFMARLSVCQE